MHYVICYDLENDRLRAKAAKLLEKHGCERVQRSVFVASHMSAKHLAALRQALHHLLMKVPLPPQDGVLIIPLPDEQAQLVQSIGYNNMLAVVAPPPLKILL